MGSHRCTYGKPKANIVCFLSCLLGGLWLVLSWSSILIINDETITSLFIISLFAIILLSALGSIGGYFVGSSFDSSSLIIGVGVIYDLLKQTEAKLIIANSGRRWNIICSALDEVETNIKKIHLENNGIELSLNL